MSLSYKTLLVIMAGLFGFCFGTAAFALDCPSGQSSGYEFQEDGQSITCSGGSNCAQAHFATLGLVSTTGADDGSGVPNTTWYEYHSMVYDYGTAIAYKVHKHYSNQYGSGSSNYKNYTLTLTEVCITPDPDPASCAEGVDMSYTTNDSSTAGACVAGCLVSSAGDNKRVQVQFEGASEIYTSGVSTGETCSGGSTTDANIKMEMIDGVPTFSDGSESVKLAQSTSGTSGDIANQLIAANPNKAIDVQTSSETVGQDKTVADTPISPASQVINVTNVHNASSGNTSGSYGFVYGADGTGVSMGGTTGDSQTTGAQGESNTDAVTCPNGYVAWDDGTGSACIGSVQDTDTTGIEEKLDGISDKLDDFGDVSFSGDEVGTFGGLTGAFYDRIKSTPLLSMGSGITFGAGDCPSINIDTVLLGSFGTSQHCDIYNTVKPLLSAVMILIFSFIGVRIILSA